jgi:hypothetical protein
MITIVKENTPCNGGTNTRDLTHTIVTRDSHKEEVVFELKKTNSHGDKKKTIFQGWK